MWAPPSSVTIAATVALFSMFGGASAFADVPACTDPGQSPPCWVLPSDTDDHPGLADCPDAPAVASGIGCENRWPDDDALNIEHYLYLPPSLTSTGKLLVFFGGGNGSSRGGEHVYPVAAQQGYHVIGLTYPAAHANACQDHLNCYGDAFREVVFGVNSPGLGGDKTTVGEHGQDSIVNRLVRVLQWADARYPGDGWGRYLTTTGDVEWSLVHLSGHSNGSSHSSFMGTLDAFRDVGRVALFAGPNDGGEGTTEETWIPATYIRQTEVPTAARYYGLVHVKNHEDNEPDNPPIYQIYKNWLTFGMEGPLNRDRLFFNPQPGDTADFDGAHMLISTDPATSPVEAHNSVLKGVYCTEEGPDPDDPDKQTCLTYGTTPIGYEAAWRCILGTGDAYASTEPVANAGPDQTLECQGGGGANASLDGSASRDVDCDVLSYRWSGPLGEPSGPKPAVFAPLGTSTVTLEVEDPWSSSPPDTTLITVRDTQPPSLQVTLTPTLLWPPDHRLVRVEATISAGDTCGAQPQVVLTSITSDQPDNGPADGNTVNDIQDGAFGTFDTSFLVRAERAGNNPSGRTYTVTYTATDASGNQTQTSATVHVPHSQ